MSLGDVSRGSRKTIPFLADRFLEDLSVSLSLPAGGEMTAKRCHEEEGKVSDPFQSHPKMERHTRLSLPLPPSSARALKYEGNGDRGRFRSERMPRGPPAARALLLPMTMWRSSAAFPALLSRAAGAANGGAFILCLPPSLPFSQCDKSRPSLIPSDPQVERVSHYKGHFQGPSSQPTSSFSNRAKDDA